jgi:hypothetical protein
MSLHTYQRRKRPKWPFVAGALALATILGFAGLLTYLMGGAGNVLEALGGTSKTENATAGRMGKPAADGKFEFTVTRMTCGVNHVGGASGKDAQGQFCLLDIAVSNVGTSAEVFADLSQTAYDAAGHEYAVDSAAGVSANKANSAFVAPINPGDAVRGKVVFDVPPGTKLAAVVLHESMFSPGVRIPLK